MTAGWVVDGWLLSSCRWVRGRLRQVGQAAPELSERHVRRVMVCSSVVLLSKQRHC